MGNLRNPVLVVVGMVMTVVLLVFLFAPQFVVQNITANPEVVVQMLGATLLVCVATKAQMLKWLPGELWYWVAGAVAFALSGYAMLVNEPVVGTWRIVFLVILALGLLAYLIVLGQRDYEHD